MTAALTFFPRKSDADAASLWIYLVAMSDIETVLELAESVSWIEKATVDSFFCGWADAWQGVGAMAEKSLPR